MPSWIRSARLVRSTSGRASHSRALSTPASQLWGTKRVLIARKSSVTTYHRVHGGDSKCGVRAASFKTLNVARTSREDPDTVEKRHVDRGQKLESLLDAILEHLTPSGSAQVSNTFPLPKSTKRIKTRTKPVEEDDLKSRDDRSSDAPVQIRRILHRHTDLNPKSPLRTSEHFDIDDNFHRWAKRTSGWKQWTSAATSISRHPANWRRHIYPLTVRYSKRATQSQRNTNIPILDIRAAIWAEKIAARLHNGDATLNLRGLARRAQVSKLYVWTQVSLWLLTYDPATNIELLKSGSVDCVVPPEMVRESLWLVTLYYSYMGKEDPVGDPNQLADIFCDLVARARRLRFIGNATTIKYMIDHCDHDSIVRVYKSAMISEAVLSSHTFLQFASYFAKNNCFDLALRALQKARKRGIEVHSMGFRSCCTTVLRHSIMEPDGFQLGWHVVNEMIQAGLEVDRPIRIIMMLNAVKSGEVNTAFTLFDSMLAEGITPEKHIIHLLLLACQLDIDNVERLQKAIHAAVQYVDVRQDPLVADTILQTLAMHHMKHNPTTAYRTLVDAYAEIFDARPLLSIDLPWQGQAQNHRRPQRKSVDLMAPTTYAMVIMVRAYISQSLLEHHEVHDLRHLQRMYLRWRELVNAGEAPYTQLATTDHMANAFLVGFVSNKNTLHHAVQVIRDMQQPLPVSSSGLVQHPPTARSWNILLHGFTCHGQTQSAEQVLSAMRAAGVEPDIVSWTTLVHGYARQQDMPGTRDALLRLEDDGMAWTDCTYKVVGLLNDQDGLKRELEHARARKR